MMLMLIRLKGIEKKATNNMQSHSQAMSCLFLHQHLRQDRHVQLLHLQLAIMLKQYCQKRKG